MLAILRYDAIHKLYGTCTSKHADARLCRQVVPSDDLEEADNDDSASPSLLNDELRQEVRSRRAKMHRFVSPHRVTSFHTHTQTACPLVCCWYNELQEG